MLCFQADLRGEIQRQEFDPQAQQGRAAMFNEAMDVVMQWLERTDPSLVPELPTLLRGAESTKPADVFARLNANHDDVLTLDEIITADIPEADAVGLDLKALFAPFAFGAGGEVLDEIPGITFEEARQCLAGNTSDLDADGIVDSFEKMLIAATGRPGLLSDLNPDTDLASFGLFSEQNAASGIAASLPKMHQFGLFSEQTLGELFGGPLFAVDPQDGNVKVSLQLERSNSLNGPFNPIANAFEYREAAEGKAFFRFRSGPVPVP
jgi:hypothetical protein